MNAGNQQMMEMVMNDVANKIRCAQECEHAASECLMLSGLARDVRDQDGTCSMGAYVSGMGAKALERFRNAIGLYVEAGEPVQALRCLRDAGKKLEAKELLDYAQNLRTWVRETHPDLLGKPAGTVVSDSVPMDERVAANSSAQIR